MSDAAGVAAAPHVPPQLASVGHASPVALEPPLVVDLDGCLVRSNLLLESAFDAARRAPRIILALPGWLMAGRARLKAELATRCRLDVAHLPYDEPLVAFLRCEHARGRRLFIATAAAAPLADAVGVHLALFEGVLATSGGVNLKGSAKAAALVARFGERGFDYAGDSPSDLAVWPHARRALAVGASRRVRARLALDGTLERTFDRPRLDAATIARAVRLHQWLKNLLVLVPLLASHGLADPSAVLRTLVAFVAFGLCASGAYLVNDLVDLPADRRHPRKRHRPLAAGALPIGLAAGAVPVLIAAGLALGTLASWQLGAVLLVYVTVTLAYSWVLKRYVLIDTMTLAALYTLRLVAGGVASGVSLSFWLLAFSMFLFQSLGMVKRHSELSVVDALNHPATHGRDYRVTDRTLLGTMGVASGYIAVLVLALYMQSPAVLDHYLRPHVLWLLCPLLMYWISRMWIKAARGEMHDDPLVFTVRDRASRVLALATAVIVLAAGPL